MRGFVFTSVLLIALGGIISCMDDDFLYHNEEISSFERMNSQMRDGKEVNDSIILKGFIKNDDDDDDNDDKINNTKKEKQSDSLTINHF